MSTNRRKFLKNTILLHGLSVTGLPALSEIFLESPKKFKRVRPNDPLWPSVVKWDEFNKKVNGRLIKLESPFAMCKTQNRSASCDVLFKNLKNPYYIGDNPALTQTSGWLDAWISKPSVYAVAAENTQDIIAAVNFARENKLRLVVKGGGHSYQGTSNSADSLLIWTRAMNNIVLHDNFVPKGCEGKQLPQPAVSVEAGAMWMHVYDAVTTKGGRYVQGGGCATVGVAGLIQSGGFGSFSKNYGLAAAALLEAEIVTADGELKVVNASNDPDLFWAVKGGGGGTFGVVTKLTLRTRKLPDTFGAVFGRIKAKSDAAFKKLIEKFVAFYGEQLFNHLWGEQISFHTDNTLAINMLFLGLTQVQAQASWKSFLNWLEQEQENYSFELPFNVVAVPAKHLWNVAFLKQYAPNLIAKDDRENAPESNIYWASNAEEAGQFLYAYRSAWLQESLLAKENLDNLVNALFSASRYWTVSLHFNKGLAGAPKEEIAAARDTATNPDVLEAFALAIIAGEGESAFPGVEGHQPDLNVARHGATQINKAMEELLTIAPNAGSYVSESDFFEKKWQLSFWGTNYPRLLAVKKKYDPDGLFFVHHGVGSEGWSADGFTKIR